MSAGAGSLPPPPATFSPPHVARCWREALALWDMNVNLGPPEPWEGHGRGHWSAEEPLAFTDMETRQVVVNFRMLRAIGAEGSLSAVLAHEIGHHVRYPHTLAEAAAMQLLEQRLIPGLKQSLTNLFYDLLINEVVGRTRADELCAVYRGFQNAAAGQAGKGKAGKDKAGTGALSPLFFFYLSIYEELWGKAPGSLVPAAQLQPMESRFPGCRGDARMFVQTFYALDNVYKQFVYFCSRFIRYIEEPDKLSFTIPLAHDMPSPDEDDFDSVLRGHGGEEAADALEEARRKGWIEDSGLQDEGEADPLATIEKITRHMPGSAQAAFKQAMVSKHYKRLVDEHIIRLPPEKAAPDPSLPSVLEEWQWGDNPRQIDWTGSVLAQGPLAAVHPLQRDLLPDEPSPMEREFPAVEIYLDTSGSMPDPASALNVMTLAAQILAASALRKKGAVRGIVYSMGKPLVSDWMRDEETARRFLLNYAGGGTEYPFDVLKAFAGERPDAIRVIVSDSDFLYNVRSGERAMEKLQYGTEQSRLLVAFLAAAQQDAEAALKPVLHHRKFRLAIVRGLDQFARAAADLADALFPAR